ncbi:MAG: hypothetical protein QOD93_3458 [Acetobacteraceae bacterium]|nr:hypothetical protein [Acetobacteraceae bacterium]
MQSPGQRSAGSAVGSAIFGGLIHADAQTGAMGGDCSSLQAGSPRLRLNLHGDADTVRDCAPKSRQSRGRNEPRMTDS